MTIRRRNATANPSPERVREALHYDPETGAFTWLVRTSNRVQVGDAAGTPSGNGYWQIKLDGVLSRTHVLAWVWMTGAWPTAREIDHIDGDGFNNRWANLRESDPMHNQWNVVAPQRNNTSGYRGVTWSKALEKWTSKVTVAGESKFLGYFATREEASAAYWAAKAQHHSVDVYQVRLDREAGLSLSTVEGGSEELMTQGSFS